MPANSKYTDHSGGSVTGDASTNDSETQNFKIFDRVVHNFGKFDKVIIL